VLIMTGHRKQVQSNVRAQNELHGKQVQSHVRAQNKLHKKQVQSNVRAQNELQGKQVQSRVRAQNKLHRKQVYSYVRAQNKLGNEKLLFHGTNRACLLGESSNSVLLCNLKECYLCSILRASFDVKKCGKGLLDHTISVI